MPIVRRVSTFTALAVLAGGAALADGLLWLEPDPPAPQTGETVRLRLFEGEPLADSPAARAADDVALYQRVWNSGRSDLLAESGDAESARFRAGESGAQLIALSTKPRIAARGAERETTFCKAFVVVGRSEPGQVHFSEVGQRLEIVPQTDPVELARGGGTLELQVIFDREPLAGARVRAIHRPSGTEADKHATTDEIGLARLRLDRPGAWLIAVEHEAACKDCGPPGRERLSSTLFLYAGS